MVSDKYQDKNKSILNYTLRGVKWNELTDIIQETYPLIMWQLYDGT